MQLCTLHKHFPEVCCCSTSPSHMGKLPFVGVGEVLKRRR
jgi:hypothetical protein